MYRKLDSSKISITLERLSKRISERFPESSLSLVCFEIHTISIEAQADIKLINRPSLILRFTQLVVAVLFLSIIALIISILKLTDIHRIEQGEVLQNLEAMTNIVVLIGATIIFLFTLEKRLKRKRALKKLHEIRSIAHVIDMHQLTKDPSRDPTLHTESSPVNTLSRFELMRYLDYCSEMLSLLGKVSALYGEASQDTLILSTVNEIESLTGSLASQIWQKITIIQSEMNANE